MIRRCYQVIDQSIKLKQIIFFISVLLVWELISSKFFPGPIEILRTSFVLFTSQFYWNHIYASMIRFFGGFLLGGSIALIIGILIGYNKTIKSLLMPIISFLFPIPKIALIPVFLIWFGFGNLSMILLIGFGVFFPAVISVYSQIRYSPKELTEAATLLGASNLRVLFEIVLPYSLPYIISELRISISKALIVLVAAEMMGTSQGIGHFILASGELLKLDYMFVGIFTLSLIGLSSNFIIEYIEKHYFNWKIK